MTHIIRQPIIPDAVNILLGYCIRIQYIALPAGSNSMRSRTYDVRHSLVNLSAMVVSRRVNTSQGGFVYWTHS